uniref:Uncharacterized protein n=1 Tax=Echeneis naucrates TaxID=173247 RepID=A0A665VIX7_ECHNA
MTYLEVIFSPCINLNQQDLNKFFNNLSLPKLREENKGKLYSCISEEEFYNTIKSLSTSKAHGNDGFEAEFLNVSSKEIILMLLCLYYQAVEEKIMPPTMRLAIISLLPKPGKDHLEVKNYRPISLLNNDYKILQKSIPLNKFTHIYDLGPALLSKDQKV